MTRSVTRLPLLAAAFLSLTVIGCSDSTSANALAGTYNATVFHVTPDGEPDMDILAAGGSLTVTLDANGGASGTISLPASVTGSIPISESLTGTYTQSGNTVQFQQSADTFVRDLAWTVGSGTLSVSQQRAGTATFTITLTKQ